MGGHRQEGHEYGTDPVSTSLGHEAVEEDRGGERVEDLSMAVPTEGADGAVPVPDSEGVLDRCSRFGVAGEEPREERVGLRRESITVRTHPRAWASSVARSQTSGLLTGQDTSDTTSRDRLSTPSRMSSSPGACRNSGWHRALWRSTARRMERCCRKVDEEQPFRRAARAPTASLHRRQRD